MRPPRALFTFPGRISIRREAPDVGDRDEGIAVAIAEEQSPTDGRLAADRKLAEKVNKAPLLNLEDLRLSFPTGEVLKGVTFSVQPGEFVGLIGESGSGKSLTAQALLQLWPHSPHQHSGRLFFQGQDLFSLSEKAMQQIRGQTISMVFQDPHASLNPTMRIGEQMTESIRYHRHMRKPEAWQLATQWLTRVGMSEATLRLRQYPHELSGGMKQRVMIGMAMMSQPALLVADEPTTALDATIQAQILELFKQLRQDFGTAILLITHDLGVVARCCDRVLVMHRGNIIEDRLVHDLFTTPQHPYTQRLLEAKQRLTRGKNLLENHLEYRHANHEIGSKSDD